MTTTDDRQPSRLDRRTLLKGGASLAAGLAIGGPFQALAARTAGAQPGKGRGDGHPFSPDYGPLAPVRDQTTGLEVLFASPGASVLNAPDNICVSPRGGLVLCEDGSGTEYLHGLTTDGEIFRFAQNDVVLTGQRNGFAGNFRGSEWCGATFEPKNGNWLFANIQSPGITVAITGPWRQGAL